MNRNLNQGTEKTARFSTPIALFGFNRPDLMRQQIERLRIIRPLHLLVVLDGPRPDREGEAGLCSEVRETLHQIDWECQVEVHRSEVNLGCRKRVSSGITWVFLQVEKAIILEDDCAPHPDFFQYAAELLERYASDSRVMHISGFNPVADSTSSDTSYHFTQFPMIWGWASWRRAWEKYDEKIVNCFSLSAQMNLYRTLSPLTYLYWNRKFLKIYRGFDTWDYQWTFACITNQGLCALPKENLMKNLGFRADATHTTAEGAATDFRTRPLDFPLRHPAVAIHSKLNAELFRSMISGFKWFKMLMRSRGI